MGAHMVSTSAGMRSRDAMITEQRLTNRLSQMQMDPYQAATHQPIAQRQGQHSAHGGFRQPPQQPQMARQQQSAGQGRGSATTSLANAPPLGSIGQRGAMTAQGVNPRAGRGAVNQQGMLADAPPLGGGMAAPRSNPRVGKGPMGQQMAGAGQKPAGRPGAKAGPTKAPAPQKKRKSDDEGSSGDPPASRRRVGPGSAAMASTGPASVDSGTSTSASDWKAEAALKLERTRQEKAQR